MRDLIRRLKPDTFEEILALVALFRPGPLQSGMVDDFINRKRGIAKVTYLHPMLESILCSTYGVVLYQEQVMQIAQTLASYSLGQADILRRAMGKKKPEEMAKQRATFLKGSLANGIEEKLANLIFDLMEKFAGYGFNKSHSAAYALIAYQTAWLKAHYPAEFMAATLSSDMDDTDKMVKFVHECQRMKIKLLPPNINMSYEQFTVSTINTIEYGLGAIKGLGKAFAHTLVQERQNNGKYRSLFDLCARLYKFKLNRRLLEALIISGACDEFIDEEGGSDGGISSSCTHRAGLIASIDKALRFAEQSYRNRSSGQIDLFEVSNVDSINATTNLSLPDYVLISPWSEKEKLQHEKKALGFYMSGHPLEAYARDSQQLVQSVEQLVIKKGKKIRIMGVVLAVKKITTNNNQQMAVVTLEDLSGRLEAVIFNSLYERSYEYLTVDATLVLEGEIVYDDFSAGLKLLTETITPWENFRAEKARVLCLHIGKKTTTISKKLGTLLKPARGGPCPVVISYMSDKIRTKMQLGDKWTVHITEELLNNLSQALGVENVVLSY